MGMLTSSKLYLYIYICNAFTPQIKGIPEDIYKPCIHCTSPQGYICIYTGVYSNVSRESGCTSKGASHFYQSKNCLDVDGMSQFILYKLR